MYKSKTEVKQMKVNYNFYVCARLGLLTDDSVSLYVARLQRELTAD